MYDVTCPFCGETIQFEGEDFPQTADETATAICPVCSKDIEIYWVAYFFACKPTEITQ